ncbi:Methionine--tRNA ligase, mitochondrial [Strongyloides ratti]|uniref:Methionine--tRNA ligase, mitochondrial n=1 Tax=Strongyloides ratti TaxID=34506 RepID=A0A090MWH4_STRRB|nr:Methionine--tRNA ligase, mitochondrial [Strongyloides ratti]CEF63739.1 Methionine--tRNA ligase, mitochondrial [Strongyloides ratti]
MLKFFKNIPPLKISLIRNKTFITTPIYYANASPHIGHIYSTIIADATLRYDKFKNPSSNINDFILTTGTDEHGIKIQKAAIIKNKSPKEFCDNVSTNFKKIFDTFNVKYTHFIRTTDESHIKCVQKMWEILYDKGYIYKDTYSGYYSHIDEAFYTKNDIEEIKKNDNIILISKETKNVVQYLEEENYMFKLKEFSPEIKKWITENDVIRPKHYINKILNYLTNIEDLSVSREAKRISWGIPVPNDNSQTIYVWLDALVNYISVVGLPNDHLTQWPPSWQIIGKDILKFHTIYWPAFLLAAGMDLPKKIFIHGHWTIDDVKMSKSLVDGLRYFLLKQDVISSDNNFSNIKAITMVNSDLVNNIGNLLMRSTVDILNSEQVYFPQKYDSLDPKILDEASELIKDLNVLSQKVNEHFENLIFYKGIEEIVNVCGKANEFFHNKKPWKQSPGLELSTVLYIIYETLRITGLLMQPITPNYSSTLLNHLGIPENKRTFDNVIFQVDELTRTSFSETRQPILKRIVTPKK